MTAANTTTAKEKGIPKWTINPRLETCNCECGCPRNFSGFQTGGICSALFLYRNKIRKLWRDDKPEGLDNVTACLRPKSTCEGNEAFQQFITKNANTTQRQALTIIYSGHAKAKGPFGLLQIL
jgi:hypothetical protein